MFNIKSFSKLFLSVFSLHFATLIAAKSQQIDVEECLKIALEKNKTLKSSQLKITGAKAKVEESESTGLPSLRLSGSYTRLSKVDPFQISIAGRNMAISPSILDNYALKATLSQPIFTGNRISSSIETAKHNDEAIRQDFEKDKSQLILDVKTAYWNLYKASQLKKSIEENIEQSKTHIIDLENFKNSGLATDNDLLKAKVNLKNLQITLLDAENMVEVSQISLAGIMGDDLNKKYTTIESAHFTSPEMPNIENLKKEALQNRAEIKAATYRIKAMESTVETVKSGWYPQINAVANYNYLNPNSRIMPAQEKFKATWDAGVNLSFDLWNWEITSKQTEQAKANLEQTKIAMEQLNDAISIELRSNYLNCQKNKEKIDLSIETIAQAEENYRVTNEKFKSGAALNSDLLDAETALLQSKINLTTSIADFQISLAKLDRSIGK